MFKFILFFFISLLFPTKNALADVKYRKKSITYLKMVFPQGVRKLSDNVDFLTGFDLDSFLEKKVREAVEMPRFDYNPVGVSGSVDLKTLASLVKQYVDEVKVDRAKAEAKMDWRFKDLVITAEDIKKIAESAYIYYPEITNFSVTVVFLPSTRKSGGVDTSISVNIGLRVHYWRVDFNTGEPIKVADLSVSHIETVKVGLIDLVPLPFPFSLLSPTVEVPETSLQAFVRCSEQAIYWLGRKLNKETRKIPDFSLFAPVDSVSFQNAFVPLTKKDGVYVDSDFEVVEEVEFVKDGNLQREKKRVGWVRARDIADGKENTLSSFQILSGSASVGQAIYEYPLLGIGLSPLGVYVLGKNAFGFSLLANISFSRAFSLELSEFYLFAGPEILIPKDGAELSGILGLKKKFYIRSVGINPELSFGFMRFATEIKDQGIAYPAYNYSLGLRPALGLEWFFSPRFSVYIIGGYKIFTPIDEVYYEYEGYEKTAVKKYNPSGFSISAGFDFTIW